MKKLSFLLAASFLSGSVMASSEYSTYEFASHKEVTFHESPAGTYTYESNCVTNTLSWIKSKKNYSRMVEKSTSTGTDVIEHTDNTFKLTSTSIDDDGAKFLSEVELTYINDNEYLNNRRTVNTYTDGRVENHTYLTLGKYVDGKFVTTKRYVDGVEKPASKQTFITVLHDNEGTSMSDAWSYENENKAADMADSNIDSVHLKTEQICTTKYTKN